MKFEPVIPTSPDGSCQGDPLPAARFTLDQPPFAGQSFDAVFRICPNPCCPCGVVGFECRTESAPDQPLRFDLDLPRRQINTRVLSAPDGVALGNAFLSEAQDPQWVWLGDLFMAVKRRQLETMDLDALVVDLPADVTAGGGTMVGYREIFPWAESLKFMREGVDWFVDDQHCVCPGCDCTETGLAFIRASHGNTRPAEPLSCAAFVFFDYRRGTFSVQEKEPDCPNPGSLLKALQATNPRLVETLRRRHGHLQQLGRRLMPKKRRRRPVPYSYLMGAGPENDELPPLVPVTPARAEAKVGRNDPCPCGSGKKFKKCCGTG